MDGPSKTYQKYLAIQKRAKQFDRLSDADKVALLNMNERFEKYEQQYGRRKRADDGKFVPVTAHARAKRKEEQKPIRYILVNRSETETGFHSQMLTDAPKTLDQRTIASARKLVPDDLTLDCVERLARILGTTEQEFASSLKVSLSAWTNFKKDFPEVQEALDRGQSDGKQALRLNNLKLGENNAAMAIHNAKHLLDQHDKATQEVNVNVRKILEELPDDAPPEWFIESQSTIVGPNDE